MNAQRYGGLGSGRDPASLYGGILARSAIALRHFGYDPDVDAPPGAGGGGSGAWWGAQAAEEGCELLDLAATCPKAGTHKQKCL